MSVVLLLVVLAGPLPWCATVARRASGGLAHELLASLVVWCLLQTLVGLGLGSIGLLRLDAVTMAELVLLASGAAWWTRRPFAARAAPRLSASEGALLAVAAVVATALLLALAATPITDYDSLAFHLPTMAEWYQRHALPVLDRIADKQTGRYPYDWEVVATLFLLPLGDDFLVASPHLIAWTILGAAVYLLAREAGARRACALGTAVLVLTLPLTRAQVTTMHVDLAFGALFAAALVFALRSPGKPVETALFFVATGLALGTKASGVVYVVPLAATFLVARAGPAPDATERDPRLVAAGVCAGLVVGAYWYVRNWVDTGNPLGHVHVVLGGVTLFPGWQEPAMLRAMTLAHVFDPSSAHDWRLFASVLAAQLGLPFGVAVVAAAVAGVTMRRADAGPRRGLMAWLGVLLVVTAIAYVTTPASGDEGLRSGRLTVWIGQAVRYAFPCLSVLGALAAVGVSRVRRGGTLLLVLVCWSVLAHTSHLTGLAAGIVAGAVLAWSVAGRRTRDRRWQGLATACVVAAIALPLGPWLHARRAHERRALYGGLVGFLDDHVPREEPIGYVDSHRAYLLYGSTLDRHVVWVPATAPAPDAWRATLRRRGVQVVALGPLQTGWRAKPEVAWLAAADGGFTRIFGDDPEAHTVVYRLRDD